MSVRELRAELADVINAAGMHDQVTFVTSRGRRVAAVVSVAIAEGAEEVRRADGDAGTATMYAVNVELHEGLGGTPSLTMAEIFEDYAGDLLREFGGDPDRRRRGGRQGRVPDAVAACLARRRAVPAGRRDDREGPARVIPARQRGLSSNRAASGVNATRRGPS
jgi:prevent-host-death family protein